MNEENIFYRRLQILIEIVLNIRNIRLYLVKACLFQSCLVNVEDKTCLQEKSIFSPKSVSYFKYFKRKRLLIP